MVSPTSSNFSNQLRQPMGSSELFNAFTGGNLQRENRTMSNIQKNQWADSSNISTDKDKTPNSMQQLAGESKLSVLQQYNPHNQQLIPKKLIDQPNFNQEPPKMQSSRQFFIQDRHSQSDVEEIEENNQQMMQDEEYYNMTEQDVDGHQDVFDDDQQVEQEEDSEDQGQDQEVLSQSDQDQDAQDHQEQPQEEDDYNTCNEDEINNLNQFQNEDHFGDDEEEDAEVIEASKSVSPDERPSLPAQIQNPNQFEYFSRSQIMSPQEQSIYKNQRASVSQNSMSYPIRSSSKTDQSNSVFDGTRVSDNAPFFNLQSCSGAVVERNDRFLILKMVPQQQNNQYQDGDDDDTQRDKKKLPSQHMIERNLESHNNKIYRETVEDINSSDEEPIDEDFNRQNFQIQKGIQYDNGQDQYSILSHSPNEEKYGKTQLMDHTSMIEESRIDYSQIRSMRNQIINQQDNEPIPVKANNQKLHNILQEQPLIQRNSSLSKSSTSDRFNKLQKLERKDFEEENPLPIEQTQNFHNINLFNDEIEFQNFKLHQQSSQSNFFDLGTQDIVEPLKMADRRQSDSSVLIRNSILNKQQINSKQPQNYQNVNMDQAPFASQTQQNSNQKIQKKSYDYVQQTNQEINTNQNYQIAHHQEDNQFFYQNQLQNRQQNDQANQQQSKDKDKKLIEEYKQLKMMMKKMQKDSSQQQQNQNQTRTKNNNLILSKSIQQNQEQNQIQKRQNPNKNNVKEGLQKLEKDNQNKSRKILQQQQSLNDQLKAQPQSKNHIGSYLSEGGLEDIDYEQVLQFRKGKKTQNQCEGGLLSVQQSVKSKDGLDKIMFQGQTVNDQSGIQTGRKNENKLSQKQSPNRGEKIRETSRGHKSTKGQNKQTNQNTSKRREEIKNRDSEDSSNENHQNQKSYKNHQKYQRDLSSHSSPDNLKHLNQNTNRTYINNKHSKQIQQLDQSNKHQSTVKEGAKFRNQRSNQNNKQYDSYDREYETQKRQGLVVKSHKNLRHTEKNKIDSEEESNDSMEDDYEQVRINKHHSDSEEENSEDQESPQQYSNSDQKSKRNIHKHHQEDDISDYSETNSDHEVQSNDNDSEENNLDQSEEEEDDNSSYDSQENQSYDSQDEEYSNDSCEKRYRIIKAKGHRSIRNEKPKIITKTIKQGNRRLKININMHDGKNQKKVKHQKEEEILMMKQRQIIQQQQMMLHMAQYPQQQILMQQQLAFQQQLLLQPTLAQQAQILNNQNIQQAINLGLQSPPQNQLDISSPTIVQSHVKGNIGMPQVQNSSFNPNLNNVSMVGNSNPSNQFMQREASAKTFRNQRENQNTQNQQLPSNDRFNENIRNNFSPKRNFNQIRNNQQVDNYVNEDPRQRGNQHVYSPKGDGTGRSFLGYNQRDQSNENQNQQANYLNKLKNRFRTDNNGDEEYYNNDEKLYDNHNRQIGSRNQNQILQNNSSPVQNQNIYNNRDQKINEEINAQRQQNIRNQRYTSRDRDQFLQNDRVQPGQELWKNYHDEEEDQQIDQSKQYSRFNQAKNYTQRQTDNYPDENSNDEYNLRTQKQNNQQQKHVRASSFVPPHQHDTANFEQESSRYDNQGKKNIGGNNEFSKNAGLPRKYSRFNDEYINQNSDSNNAKQIQRFQNNQNTEDHDDESMILYGREEKLRNKNTGNFERENSSQDQRNKQRHFQEKEALKNSNSKAKWKKQQRDGSRSGNEDRDQSMEEGVSVANLRESIKLSQKADFKLISEKSSRQAPKNKEFEKIRATQEIKNEKDKKAQVIVIGFDDDQQQKGADIQDPFKNKPQLKLREKVLPMHHQEADKRSKSSKPLISKKQTNNQISHSNKESSNADNKPTSIEQNSSQPKRVPFQRNKLQSQQQHPQQQQDMQPNEKITGVSTKVGKKKGFDDNQDSENNVFTLKNLNQSPLKKAVKDIQAKEINKGNQKKGGELMKVDLSKLQDFSDQFAPNDEIDPSHNKDLAIEIFDKGKQKSGVSKQQEKSLAEMFLSKKKEALEKQGKQPSTSLSNRLDQDYHSINRNQEISPDRPTTSQQQTSKKQEKTKEELAELRKKMMKSRVKSTRENFTNNHNLAAQDPNQEQAVKKAKEKEDLMLRLAMGKKVKIDEKEMKKLTSKNFQNLPEIKKKREEEKKRQELAERKAAAADYMKQFAEKRRLQVLKKKKSNANIVDDE